MALISLVAKNVTGSFAQAIGNSFMLDKVETKALSNLIRVNTKRYWKPIAGAVVVGTCIYGAIKIRSEILLAREEFKFQPTAEEVENLSHVVTSVESRCALDVGNRQTELEEWVDELFSKIEDEPELEDCLENDETAKEETKWINVDKEIEILELKFGAGDFAVDEKSPLTAEQEEELRMAKLAAKKAAYHKEQYKKQRKRVRPGQLSKAVRGLTAKIRASFPVPDGSPMQQKAMSLYAAKECRKVCVRESEIAHLIPKAVALASIPTTSQVDLRVITNMEAVQLKYNKMAWSGYKNKSTWLAKLASNFA